MIRFGPMSIVLLCAALYGLLRAVMLCCIPIRLGANRLMAALILILALYTGPYIIGYAGYYDAYPWLSFAPYKLTLAIGPLFYLYLSALRSGDVALPHHTYLQLPSGAAAIFVLLCHVLAADRIQEPLEWQCP